MEEWRLFQDTSYQVSSLGRVKNGKGRLMHPSKTDAGYHHLHLRDTLKKGEGIYVHRMVAITFVPNPQNLPLVDHIDRQRANNRSDNLRWVTAKQNQTNRGGRVGGHKRPVTQKTGDAVKTWATPREAEDALGLRRGSVSEACGKGTCVGGSHWVYEQIEVDGEEWKQSSKFQDCHVSSHGRVKGPRGLVCGYLSMGYRTYRNIGVHRLVAEEFCVKPLGTTIVNHKDGDRQNNHKDNLEWCTVADNTRHAIQAGLKTRHGARSRPVERISIDGTTIRYESLTEAAIANGADTENSNQLVALVSRISAVCLGKRLTTAGYRWKYAEEESPTERHLAPQIAIVPDNDPIWAELGL